VLTWLSSNDKVLAAVVALFAVLGGTYAFLRWGVKGIRSLSHRWKQRKRGLPRETIRLVPVPNEQRLSVNGEAPDSVGVYGRWYVSNITDLPAHVLAATLLKPRVEGGFRMLDIDGRIQDENRGVAAHGVAMIHVGFRLPRASLKLNEDLQATVEFVDHLRNAMLVRTVFRAEHGAESEQTLPPAETLESIDNPVSKNVASFLKLELAQLQQSGLQPMLVVRLPDGKTQGAFDEWWDSNKPRPFLQLPRGAKLESDNAERLVDYYNSGSSGDRTVFLDALMSRLSETMEYAPVAYLALLVMFRLDGSSRIRVGSLMGCSWPKSL